LRCQVGVSPGGNANLIIEQDFIHHLARQGVGGRAQAYS
jgi:hypothetical protein